MGQHKWKKVMKNEIKISSWNVNGIRACKNKGFLTWLEKENPDILCIQETKAHEDQLSEDLLEPPGYSTLFSSATKKGYSGVALYYKNEHTPLKLEGNLGIEEFDNEGRTIIAEFDSFILFGCYFPNGQRDHNRVPYKLKYSEEILKRALKLKKARKKPIIITGDVNTAHAEIDLKNPKANKKTTGFLPIERAYLDKVINKGFVDIFRNLHPDEEGHYTWWTYRSNCRERNIGWRIDYFLISEDLSPFVKDCYHLPKVMGSDHCPIVLKLQVP